MGDIVQLAKATLQKHEKTGRAQHLLIRKAENSGEIA